QALERQLASLRETVVQEVLREVGPALARNGESSTRGSSAALQKAISAIQAGTTQKEILRALLDNTVLYSGRAALFVVKNGAAMGWQGIAFGNNDAIKDFPLDIGSGLASRVMRSRASEKGTSSGVDQHFTSKFGVPSEGDVVLLPLLLKDKISALVYADSGIEGGTLDVAALDVLVRATSAWLEVISQRKQAQKDGLPEPEMHAAPSVNDPFAAHAPIHGKAHAETVPEVAMSAAAAWGGPTSIPSGEDGEIHRKAQRFARLLIDEIKLYNHAKVADGRKHRDLYDRLREDIEKSRATYQKRYGNSAAGAADYFSQELIRSLAEDDVSLLGSSFRRIHQAFVASATLKPMAQQLLQNRTAQAYAGVESFARKHSAEDAGSLAWLAVGYAHFLDRDFAKAVDPLSRAKPHAGDIGDYVAYYLAASYQQSGRLPEAVAALNTFDQTFPQSLLIRDAHVLYAN